MRRCATRVGDPENVDNMVDAVGGRRDRLDVRHVGVRVETREEDAEAQERREGFVFQKKIGFPKGKTKYNIIYYVHIVNNRQVPTSKNITEKKINKRVGR